MKNKFYRQELCDMCDLWRTRTQVVVSDGGIRPCNIAVIGEGPGANEDENGVPFVGRSGQLLRRYLLHYANVNCGFNAIVLNTVSCRPPGNRNPTSEEVKACRNWLRLNLAIINPKIILLVGKVSAGVFVKGNVQNGFMYSGIDLRKEWRQDRYSFRAFAIYHPAYILRNQNVSVKAGWAKTIQSFGRYAKRNSLL